MRRQVWRAAVVAWAGAAGAIALGAAVLPRPQTAQTTAPRPPRIRPAYTSTVIPPNIAPLNFRIEEPGERFRVRVQAGGQVYEQVSRSPQVRFPAGKWRELLHGAQGSTVAVEVSVTSHDAGWVRFAPITYRVAREPIDRYLVFRRMRPFYNLWSDIGIYQRDLESDREWPVLLGRHFGDGCLNCHSFRANHADVLSIGTRSATYGNAALMARGARVTRIGATWGYTAWSPDGRRAAYSLNKVRQFFHSAGAEPRDVVDLDSDIAVYVYPENQVVTTHALADPNRLETYPAWSPDGRALYYCSAPIPWERRDRMPPKHYDQVRYDLMRIPFDPRTGAWGRPETLLSARQTGLSILLPRPSPDGRFLLFCMCRYGCFPVFQPSSDLYLMDLRTKTYRRLDINSDQSESWHSWSSNGRWIVFSSKRGNGLFARPYFSYVDESGRVYPPFVLPQRDPDYYDSCARTLTVPELVVDRVPASPRAIARAARSSKQVSVQLPDISMTRKPPSPAPAGGSEDSPWKSRGNR